jgi:DHA1 family bicyclomycin/chloramphenicol resistance-like MFS transporter
VFLALAGIATLLLVFADLGETVQGKGTGFREQFRTYPELLKSPRFWGYVLCSAFASGGFFALLGGTSFIADTIFGLSPLWSGIALGAPAIGYAAGNFISGRFSVRFGVNRMAIMGSLVLIFGMGSSLLLTLSGVSHPLGFFGFCVFLGLGNGIVLPNVMAGSISVRPHLAGTASGLGGAIMIGGGAALSQFAGSILTVESGTLPLQLIMFSTAVMSLLSVLFVIWRERQIA